MGRSTLGRPSFDLVRTRVREDDDDELLFFLASASKALVDELFCFCLARNQLEFDGGAFVGEMKTLA